MEFFLAWLVMASVQLAATMSPGPAFVVSVRNSMAYTRKVGVFTSVGLALGVSVHIVFVLVGLSYLIAESVFLYSLIKYVGAAYLFYIGVKAILSMRAAQGNGQKDAKIQQRGIAPITIQKAVMQGFLTNLLNPKAVIFFTAVYAQFIDPSTPVFMHLAYGVTSILIEFSWFAGVALVLTNARIKEKFMTIMHRVEGVCGGLMIALGVKLALSR